MTQAGELTAKQILTPGSDLLRAQFPTIKPDEIYLDSVASSLTPRPVVEEMNEYYYSYRANVHRGSYDMSMKASHEFETALAEIGRFINADASEIVVTTNATQALNTIALTLDWQAGDEIILSTLEHTSNMAPWVRLKDTAGAEVRWYNPGRAGVFDLEEFEKLFTPKTRLVALTYVSNVLGVETPVQEVGRLCKERGVLFVIDACQAVPHMPMDVRALDCDFLAFSGHKMLGPTGIGVLYMRQEHAESLMPAILGGGTIDTAGCYCPTLDNCELNYCTFSELPYKWHAGTPPIAETIGLRAAIQYVETIGFDQIKEHDRALMRQAMEGLRPMPGVRIYGPSDPDARISILSFNIDGVPPLEVGRILNDNYRIGVRTGHHCSVNYFIENDEDDPQGRSSGNVRASFYLYNTANEVDRFLAAMDKITKTLVG